MGKKSKNKTNGPAAKASATGPSTAKLPLPEGISLARKDPKAASNSVVEHEKQAKSGRERQIKARDVELGDQVIERYNMELSKKRLDERGFHPAVTTKTREELFEIYGTMLAKYSASNRPSYECFQSSEVGFENTVSQPRKLTRALLISRRDLMRGRTDVESQGAATGNRLARLLDTVDVGGRIAELILADGYKTIHNVAITASQTWTSLANSSKVWDFFAGDFVNDGPAGAFIAVAPEYTIGEFKYVELYDPCGLNPDNPLSSWFSEAMKAETHVYVSLDQLHRRLHQGRKNAPQLGIFTAELVKRTQQLAHVEHIHGSNQFNSGRVSRVFDPSAYFAVTRLRRMLNKIFQQRKAMRVLHFHKTPFLDRRMLAVILRACPRVEMVGIYDCPLIHFGDVLCLLDLIHEINCKRRQDGLPQIKALDFFPRYHEGMPYRDDRAETFGLTWGALDLETVQRGFFCIILRAFMKAKAMKLDLLFAKGKAFRDFLFKVPTYSLAVPSFLDALYRWSDLQRKQGGSENERKQTMYDLLKPVRLGIENVNHDWPQWYSHTMGKHLIFCSSCGYETLEEFFTSWIRGSPPHARTCAGCLLQHRLDMESDHLKTHKSMALTHLFPEWDASSFNQDAPLAAAARGLVRLESTISERPKMPPLRVNSEGNVFQPGFRWALVRDKKLHGDSLQNLPSLSDLVENQVYVKHWAQAIDHCNHLDMYSRLIRRLTDESRVYTDGNKLDPNRCDGGMPDHAEERQPPRRARMPPSWSFSDITKLEVLLYEQGWL